jgi:hypothetical protein
MKRIKLRADQVLIARDLGRRSQKILFALHEILKITTCVHARKLFCLQKYFYGFFGKNFDHFV